MNNPVPNSLQSLFWDFNFASISWISHRDFMIRRILQAGSWDAIQWLRGELGDDTLRQWIEQREGGGLDPRQLRFWGLVLGLPRTRVNSWIKKQKQSPWLRRAPR